MRSDGTDRRDYRRGGVRPPHGRHGSSSRFAPPAGRGIRADAERRRTFRSRPVHRIFRRRLRGRSRMARTSLGTARTGRDHPRRGRFRPGSQLRNNRLRGKYFGLSRGGLRYVHEARGRTVPTQVLSTCNCAYRREAYLQAGGCPEDPLYRTPGERTSSWPNASVAWADVSMCRMPPSIIARVEV